MLIAGSGLWAVWPSLNFQRLKPFPTWAKCRRRTLRIRSAKTRNTPPGPWGRCRLRVRELCRLPSLRSKCHRRRSRTYHRWRRSCWPTSSPCRTTPTPRLLSTLFLSVEVRYHDDDDDAKATEKASLSWRGSSLRRCGQKYFRLRRVRRLTIITERRQDSRRVKFLRVLSFLIFFCDDEIDVDWNKIKSESNLKMTFFGVLAVRCSCWSVFWTWSARMFRRRRPIRCLQWVHFLPLTPDQSLPSHKNQLLSVGRWILDSIT